VNRTGYRVECNSADLSSEALLWLENESADLCWVQLKWRIWEDEATEDELTYYEISERKVYRSRGLAWKPPMIKRSIDVVRFASKSDAMYFKMKYL